MIKLSPQAYAEGGNFFPLSSFLVVVALIPGFLSFGSLNLVFGVLFFWSLAFPQTIPLFLLFVLSLFQDVLGQVYLGSHGLLYGFFLFILMSQRPHLHNRSFFLRWSVFSIFLLVLNGINFFGVYRIFSIPFQLKEAFYSFFIPVVTFPLIIRGCLFLSRGMRSAHG